MNKVLILSSGLIDSHDLIKPYIDRLHVYLSKQCDVVDIRNVNNYNLESINQYNHIVFAFMLSMYSIPSTTLEIFNQLEGFIHKDIEISTLIVCDEYECEKCDLAYRIIKNWCHRENLLMKSYIRIASGLVIMKTISGPVVSNQLKKFSEAIVNHESHIFSATLISEKQFLQKANAYWFKEIKNYIKNSYKK